MNHSHALSAPNAPLANIWFEKSYVWVGVQYCETSICDRAYGKLVGLAFPSGFRSDALNVPGPTIAGSTCIQNAGSGGCFPIFDAIEIYEFPSGAITISCVRYKVRLFHVPRRIGPSIQTLGPC